MEISELKKLTDNLQAYSGDDIDHLTFMTEDELEHYQREVEEGTGNLSDWDHLRAVLTFKKMINDMK